MCSIPGLPTTGANVTVFITRVNLNPLCTLVEFWGNFNQGRELAYEQMKREIQIPRKRFCEHEGNPGDVCLIRENKTWHRARILSRCGDDYNVFLIDNGTTLWATSSILAWGQTDSFYLPPEIEFCVLANVSPLSFENRWSPTALEFLKSLCGKTIHGRVQDVIMPDRTILLDITSVSKQMFEVGFARKQTIEKFKHLVTRSSSSRRTQQEEKGNELENLQQYFYPELQTEMIETVEVTEVIDPLHIFCRLHIFSQELKNLTAQINEYYEGRSAVWKPRPQASGSPCASKGSDGKWYRSVQIGHVSDDIAAVLHVDYGMKDFVQVGHIRPLAAKFFRMPVATYACSLHGIMDKGTGWTTGQIDHLRSVLLHQTFIAKFEDHNLSEDVHYVTLYGNDNVNINNLFGVKEKCLLISDCTRKARLENEAPLTNTKASNCQADKLAPNSDYVATIQFVQSPSEFWIQTRQYASEFNQLMGEMSHLYENGDYCKGLQKLTPEVGLFCAARYEDDAFYRVIVNKVINKQVEVYFVDYGNKAVVDCCDLRVLRDKHQKLPALAIKCSLAGIKPVGKEWTQNASDFFSKLIADKFLDLHVSAKCQDKYTVELIDKSSIGEGNINKLMCKESLAVNEDVQEEYPSIARMASGYSGVSGEECSDVYGIRSSGPLPLPTCLPFQTPTRSAFKEHLFTIGSSVEVNVSFIQGPSQFWCQLFQNALSLKMLMHDIQNHYASSSSPQPVEAVCVARHPDNGMWYRARKITQHLSPHVDVQFIDYGQTFKVPLRDLRPINPAFLNLKPQAFQCSLVNTIHHASPTPSAWSDAASSEFHSFVASAASSNVRLKCKVHAIMYDSQGSVLNVVDIESPSESVCSLLAQKGVHNPTPSKTVPLTPAPYEAYNYSTHDVDVGAEEKVWVTSVKGVHHFHGQLRRNTAVVDKMTEDIQRFCHRPQNTNCPRSPETVCFAKYTDGQWYRGQIKSTQPKILVHFVDYGDILAVEEYDILPISAEASVITAIPVQALQFELFDVPRNVSSEVNRWFENNAIGHWFTAAVVAKDSAEMLTVKLYDGKTNVNLKIKERLNEILRRERFPTQGAVNTMHTHKVSLNRADVTSRDGDNLNSKSFSRVNQDFNRKEKKPEQKAVHHYGGRPHEDARKYTSTSVNAAGLATLQRPAQKPMEEHEMQSCGGSKLTDLPSRVLKPGFAAEVYVSHCNSPSSFFVQLTKEEDDIYSLVDKLNCAQSSDALVDLNELQPGDVVTAEYPSDGAWYRAVVRNKSANGTVHVEFIDFGNEASISPSKVRHLDEQFLKLPKLSIHCLLDVSNSRNQQGWSSEQISQFQRATGENGLKKLLCKFIKDTGSIWEVSLEDQGIMLAESLFKDGHALKSDDSNERQIPRKRQDVPQLQYKRPNVCQGLTVEVYASSIVGPHYFWCQYANSEELDKITVAAQEAGNTTPKEVVCMDTLFPGSPCLARYTEDQQWYRAQMINKTGNVQSVLFVDYGNESEVDQISLRSVPHNLLESPPQAWLCQLEGFKQSEGSWNDAAADRFYELLVDEPLKVTVVKIGNVLDRHTPQYQVKVECKEHIVNDLMRIYWNGSSTRVCSQVTQSDNQNTDTAVADTSNDMLHLAMSEFKAMSQCVMEEITPKLNPTELFVTGTSPNMGNCTPPSIDIEVHDTTLTAATPELHHNIPIKIPLKQQISNNGSHLECDGDLANLSEVQEQLVHPSVHSEGPQSTFVTEHGRGIHSVSNASIESLPKLADLPSRIIRPGLTTEVYVSHVNSPTSFFVQLVEDENSRCSLVELLNATQPSNDAYINKDIVQQDDLVNAQFPDDGSWYRAVVRKTNENGMVQVEFTDFGNEATISSHKLCRLDEQFLEFPRHSIHCGLDGATDVNKELEQEIMRQLGNDAIGRRNEKKLLCKFIKKTRYVWEVSLVDQGNTLGDSLKVNPVVELDNSDTSEPQMSNSKHAFLQEDMSKKERYPLPYKKAEVCQGQTIEVYASSIVGPHYFWCQYANSEELDKITVAAQEAGNTTHHTEEVVCMDTLCPGSPCLARYTEDQQWYRAQVINKTGNGLSVLFVDYGNESEVDQNSLRSVPHNLLESPSQAWLCLLEGFEPSEGFWNDAAADRFYELLVDKPLKVTVLKMGLVLDSPTPQYQVKVECKEHIANDLMRSSWIDTLTHNQSSATAPVPIDKPLSSMSESQCAPETGVGPECSDKDNQRSEPRLECTSSIGNERLELNDEDSNVKLTSLVSDIPEVNGLSDISSKSHTTSGDEPLKPVEMHTKDQTTVSASEGTKESQGYESKSLNAYSNENIPRIVLEDEDTAESEISTVKQAKYDEKVKKERLLQPTSEDSCQVDDTSPPNRESEIMSVTEIDEGLVPAEGNPKGPQDTGSELDVSMLMDKGDAGDHLLSQATLEKIVCEKALEALTSTSNEERLDSEASPGISPA